MDSRVQRQLVLLTFFVPVLGYFGYDAYLKYENSPARVAARTAAQRAVGAPAGGVPAVGGVPSTGEEDEEIDFSEIDDMIGAGTAVPGAPTPDPAARPTARQAPRRGLGDVLPALVRQRERTRAALAQQPSAVLAPGARDLIATGIDSAEQASGVRLGARAVVSAPEASAGRERVTWEYTLFGTEAELAAFLEGVLQLDPGLVLVEDLVVRPATTGAPGALVADLRIVAWFATR
ncbi:MAG: hypothetical protein HZA54_13670 [Planctomycetes bacterium]|nr:hypothetical protein [Planctomycetota bacterium]